MKRYLLLLLISVVTLQVHADPFVKLHGTIKNPIADSITVTYYTDYLVYGAQKFGTTVSKDGKFDLKFPVRNHFTQITIQHGDQATELIVSPGYNLDMTLDADHFDSTLYYTGKGEVVANFMARHMLESGFMNDYDRKIQPLCAKDTKDFKDAIEKMRLHEDALLKDYDRGQVPPDFLTYWENCYKFKNYYYMLMYPVFHEMMKQHSYQIKNIPKEDYEIAKSVPEIFNDHLMDVPSYQSYLDNIFYKELEVKGMADSANSYPLTDSVINLAYKKLPPRSAEYFLANNLNSNIKYLPAEKTAKNLDRFKEHYPKSIYLPKLEKEVALHEQTLPGKPAMDFTIHTIDGKTMQLSDLKGKVVYLDFWASWCGPCRGEMPFAKKVEEHYEGKDVVFLYVSIDEDTAAWKKAINQFGIQGVHMCDDGGWTGKVAQLYGIQGVPSYFLIDKNGNFATAQTPRPSSTQQLEGEIDKLLE